MMKRTIFLLIGLLALIASGVMYFVGKDSSHLSELYDMFWVPLPLAAISLLVAFTNKK